MHINKNNTLFYIDYKTYDPYFNMAADEYFLSLCENKAIPALLRLYGWNQPTFSIGYYFKSKHLNCNKIKKSKLAVVRRITGGNLLYHDNDLSFSFIAQKELLNIWTVKEIYLFISQFFIEALLKLGIDSFINQFNSKVNTPVCFDSLSQYEIVDKSSNNKIVASAQKILKNSFLQHGSIFFSEYNIWSNLKYLNSLKLKLLYLYKVCFVRKKQKKYFIENEKVINSIKKSFEKKFNIIEYKITENDLMNINKLMEEKYFNDKWNFRK